VSYDLEAAERIRELLAGRDDLVEKRMVSGLSFLVNGNMCCGRYRYGADGPGRR
jgi:hypothetical protein